MEPTRLTKQIFEWDYQIGNNNWCNNILSILTEVNCSHIYEQKQVCNVGNIHERILLNHNQKWSQNVKNKPKLRSYIKFKSEYEVEPYLKLNLVKWERSILAQFRMGVLPLYIETGRYKNIRNADGTIRKLKPEERICTLCTLNEVEDEIHFLLECPVYTNLRSNLFTVTRTRNTNFDTLNNDQKLTYLMKNCIKPVAKYLFFCVGTKETAIIPQIE